ncbi:MAG: HPP family protein [Magnetospirillum sp.]
MRRFLRRHQPPACRFTPWKAAFGAMIAMGICALMAQLVGEPLLVAPLAASAVLVFAAHESPMAQPANVIGGHLLSTAAALAVAEVLPQSWWAMALAVGLAIALMTLTRLTHPPAGADALVVSALHPGWGYLLFPIAFGAVLLVLAATVVHRLVPSRRPYPLPVEESGGT